MHSEVRETSSFCFCWMASAFPGLSIYAVFSVAHAHRIRRVERVSAEDCANLPEWSYKSGPGEISGWPWHSLAILWAAMVVKWGQYSRLALPGLCSFLFLHGSLFSFSFPALSWFLYTIMSWQCLGFGHSSWEGRSGLSFHFSRPTKLHFPHGHNLARAHATLPNI